MFTGRRCYLRWVERLGAGLAAVAIHAVALIWKLARMDFLTIRGWAGRLGRVDRALLLPAAGGAVAVNRVALTWELARAGF